jgi:hypothetical protein
MNQRYSHINRGKQLNLEVKMGKTYENYFKK